MSPVRHSCLTRCLLAYTTLCGLALAAVSFYDMSLSSTLVSLPPPLSDLSRLVLPERFCSVSDLFNQSEPQVVVISRPHQQQDEKYEQRAWPLASFDSNRSTEENYTAANTNPQQANAFVGRFAKLRRQLDYSYHRIYTTARQELQDRILTGMLDMAEKENNQRLAASCPRGGASLSHSQAQNDRWVVFTAGVMGAGKTHTIQMLSEKNRFPLSSFVWVDPDQIRQCLPEFERLVRYDASQAGERTRKEAGMLSEILTLAALEEGQSVIVDGSLRDAEWYEDYFTHLRGEYPGIKIAIFHVTAPRESVLERAASRARITGRVVPISLLEKTMVQVPASVAILKTQADFFVELHNAGGDDDVQVVQPEDMDWGAFTRHWVPSCHAQAVVS